MSARVSKFLSLVLRHDPARIGITLDEAGWTDVDALLAACAAHGVAITRAELDALVASSDKQRYALSPDGARIRANQGHSVPVSLGLLPATPPERLYHGTVDAALPGIRAQGIVKGARHHVHLSADMPTATKVGSRRGKPVLLVVRAAEMAAAGHVFYRSENGVWLADHVPPAFIDVPTPVRSRGQLVAIAEQTLAACEAGRYSKPTGEVVEISALVAAAREATTLHALGETLRAPSRMHATEITVTSETTLAAVTRLAGRGHVGLLNYASAKNPGGGFLGGSAAQEESIARSSALYPCLRMQMAHYDQNRAHHDAHYLDLAIVSRDVPILRDDDGGWLDRPVLATVVTCAAPNARALRQHGAFDAARVTDTFNRRCGFVLALAAHHGIERLVLGAWGAGAFGSDPVIVADAFRAQLAGAFAGAFAEVVFAIPGEHGANHAAFVTAFAT
ncbi:MAG TPA: RNA 2'-phosphotransferase [Kofleriaceae bacterium]|nr:RNA 2'-phosphotransferase [Kofleriaceae bacterium]